MKENPWEAVRDVNGEFQAGSLSGDPEDPEATRLRPGIRGQESITPISWHFKGPREIPQLPPCQA